MPQKGIWGSNPQLSASMNRKKGSIWGPFFNISYVSWGFEPERARGLNKRESVCNPWAKSRQALKPEGMRSMPGHPQLSVSLTLKKGSGRGPFLVRRMGAGDSYPKKGGVLSDTFFQ